MSSSNYYATGEWTIPKFGIKSQGKYKSDSYKCGEESFKLVIYETESDDAQLEVIVKFEKFKSDSKLLNVLLVLQNQGDSSKSIRVPNNLSFSSTELEKPVTFPIKFCDILNQAGWIDASQLKIGFCISDAENAAESAYPSTTSQNPQTFRWEIHDITCEHNLEQQSPEYTINGLTFQVILHPFIVNTQGTTTLDFDVKCIEQTTPGTQYSFDNILHFGSFRDQRERAYLFKFVNDKYSFLIYIPYSYFENRSDQTAYLDITCKVDDLQQYPQIENTNKVNNYVEQITANTPITASSVSYASNSNAYAYDSNEYVYQQPEETGYVGLYNQGATCYMNSMLQSLFHIPAFRKIVYEMQTTGTEDISKSIPLSLQHLFVGMQCSKKPCSTKALTRSFGWDDTQTFVQHDVQEFCRVLIDNLEEKLKGTPLDGQIAKLFRGTFRSFIRAVNVPFESSKEEFFYDLSMVVKDTPDLASSFRKYIETELLDGDNQYSTEQFGKQDVRMGTEFVQFPTVLHLHLRRFEYDFNYDRMEKINSRFEFPASIDLSEFLAPNADRSRSNIYDLYGVLVHSGSTSGGHYYAFLKTGTNSPWYKFDDSRVTQATEAEAIDENFGGSTASTSYNYNYGYSSTYNYNYTYDKYYSAYMLVYVRHDDAEQVFAPIEENSIPMHLRTYFKDHQNDYEPSYSNTTLKAKLMPEEALIANTIRGKNEFGCTELEKQVTINKEEVTFRQFYELVAKKFDLDPEEIRIFQSYQQFVPYSVIENNDEFMNTIYYDMFFVQKKPREEPLKIDTTSKILIFIKFFDASLEVPIQYLGARLFDKANPISAFFPVVLSILGLPEEYADKLKAYEVLTSYIREVDQNSSYSYQYLTLQSLTFQLTTSREESQRLLATSTFPFAKKSDLANVLSKYQSPEDEEKENEEKVEDKATTDDNEEDEAEKFKNLQKYIYTDIMGQLASESFIDYMESQKDPIKAIVYNYNEPQSQPLGYVEFPANLTLEQLKQFVINIFHLEFNPLTDLLLLYRKEYYGNGPYVSPITSNSTLSYEFTIYNQSTKTVYQRIFYRLLHNMDEVTLAQMSTFDVFISEDGCCISKEVKILLPKNSLAKDLRDKLVELNEIHLTPEQVNNQSNYRISRIYDHTIESVYTDLNLDLPYYDSQMRFDLVPQEQQNIDPQRFILASGAHVTHERGIKKFIEQPFFFLIDKQESYDDFNNRLKEKLKLGDDLKYRTLISDNKYLNQKHYLKPGTKTIGEQIQAFNLTETPMIFIFHSSAGKSNNDDEVRIYN